MPKTAAASTATNRSTSGAPRVDWLPLGPIGIVVFSDIVCPWSHIAVFRLLRAVHERGLEGEINIDHRAFPLELLGDETPDRARFDLMVEALRDIEPDAGWSPWAGDDEDYPSSSLLALEAVQAAKAVSPAASAALDRALRLAVFAQSRPIDRIETVMAVAGETEVLDVDTFEIELCSGRARRELDQQTAGARSDDIPASPTIVLPNGTISVNPGIEFHVDGEVPTVDADDPAAYDDLLEAYLEQRTYD